MPMPDTATMNTDPLAAASKAIHIWLSPSFPVGAFAFSHGLEWAVESGQIGDRRSLAMWLNDLLHQGGLRTDTTFVALTHKADTPERLTLNALALALAPSAERRLETTEQGAAFLRAVAQVWPAADITALARELRDGAIAYPVAVGTASAAHCCDAETTLFLFLLAGLQNLTSAAARLGLIGQTDAQLILSDLYPDALTLAGRLTAATQDDLASAAWNSDICAMRHETQYSRLFRS